MPAITAKPITATPITARPLTAYRLGESTEGASVFNPISLFASGEDGAYFDAATIATLLQDAAGTTPVTAVGQPIGLLLDQSQGTVDLTGNLGPELVTNGGFDTDSGWTKGAGWTISVGVASSDGSQVSNSLLYQDAGTVSGKRYLVTFTVSSFTSGKITAYSGDSGAGTARSATGAYSQVITCSGANANRINLVASSSFVGSIDNISVRCIETGAVLYNTDSSDWDRSKT